MSVHEEKPAAIVFDAVGTLIFPVEPVPFTYSRIAAGCGARIPVELIASRFSEAFRDLFANKTDTVTSELLEQSRWRELVRRVIGDRPETGIIFEALWQHYADGNAWQVYPDVQASFARVREARIRIAVASNFDQRLTEICQFFDPFACVEAVYCSSEIGFSKPDPRFFHAVAVRMKCSPDRLLMVGDDANMDVNGARDAGWQARLIDRSHGRLHEVLDTIPGLVG